MQNTKQMQELKENFKKEFDKDFGIVTFTYDIQDVDYNNQKNNFSFTYEIGSNYIVNSGIEYNYYKNLTECIKEEIKELNKTLDICYDFTDQELEEDGMLEEKKLFQRLVKFFKSQLQ